jgi:hypothetical protein
VPDQLTLEPSWAICVMKPRNPAAQAKPSSPSSRTRPAALRRGATRAGVPVIADSSRSGSHGAGPRSGRAQHCRQSAPRRLRAFAGYVMAGLAG